MSAMPAEASAKQPGAKYDRLIAAAKSVPAVTTIVVHPCDESSLRGALALSDRLRASAPAAIAELKQRGLATILLSGDRKEAAMAMGTAAGVDEAHGGVAPRDKAAYVSRLRQSGRRVVMVGDGVNDALALGTADIGIAMGTGSDVAIEAADVALMRDEPRLVAAALDIAARTRRKVTHNLAFAFAYNIIGIPLAMAGALSPAFAGAAMALSSVSVLTSALMLTRWRPDFTKA